MTCYLRQFGWRGWRASVCGVLAWIACQHKWRAKVGYVVDELAWVLRCVWCGQRTKVNGVSDIGGNIGGELDSIAWVAHYF